MSPAIPEPVVADALGELGQYLSDRLAPLMVSDAMATLARAPTERVAREVHTWAGAQRTASGRPLSDYLFHALRKIQLIGDFRLMPPSLFDAFFTRLKNAVLETTPAAERATLAADLACLGESHTESVEQVERLHRPGERSGEEKPGTPATTPGPAASGPAVSEAAARRLLLPASQRLPEQTLRRLSLVLDALQKLAPAAGAPARATLAADAFATAALGTSSAEEMEAQLEEFRGAGLAGQTYDVFRLLGDNLPGWWTPALADAEASGAPIAAMRRMIGLAQGREEAARRFREMVENAIEQFNAGALGRAVRMLDLALRMIEKDEVDPAAVEPLRAKGHHSLDPDRLRDVLAEREHNGFPQVVLRFFRAFEPEALLDALAKEGRRERRLLLLSLMEAHGDEGRRAAFERLVRTPTAIGEYYVFRNLVQLLRTIPRSVNTTWEPEHEIARVIRFLVPDSPLFLLKEIGAYLTEMQHPVAEQALVLFVDALEDALTSADASGTERVHWRSALDQSLAALAVCPSPRAWAAVVDHGLRNDPRLGTSVARLSELGCQDLSATPLLNHRLTTAAFAELPDDARAATKDQLQRAHAFVRALAGTRSAEARAFFEILAMRCPESEAGREAQRALHAAVASAQHQAATASLVGDLGSFSLPALLQNLGDLRKTGTLALSDTRGSLVATVVLDEGRVAGASMGSLRDTTAVYAILERPLPGRFSFAPDLPASTLGSERAEIIPLLLEGLRRQDELRRLEALLPDDTLLVLRTNAPPAIPEEPDRDLGRVLWTAAAAGATVRECEERAGVDPYRVRAALVFWVESGALESVFPLPAQPAGDATL